MSYAVASAPVQHQETSADGHLAYLRNAGQVTLAAARLLASSQPGSALLATPCPFCEYSRPAGLQPLDAIPVHDDAHLLQLHGPLRVAPLHAPMSSVGTEFPCLEQCTQHPFKGLQQTSMALYAWQQRQHATV